MRRSSQTVIYTDLVAFAERALASSEKKLAGAKAVRAFSLEGLTHEVETGKVLVRMLKKGLPTKQTNFLTLFDQTR